MPSFFIDSSVLVKRYRHETGSTQANQLMAGEKRLFVARLAQIEVASAIARRARAQGTSPLELDAVLSLLSNDLAAAFEIVEFDLVVVQKAMEISRRLASRAADAIQLASAILLKSYLAEPDFTMLSSDLELNTAALSEDISVVNPTIQAS